MGNTVVRWSAETGKYELSGSCSCSRLHHVLLEDCAKAFKVVKVCLTEVMCHATFDTIVQFSSCCNDSVFRGDRRVHEIFVLVEDCDSDLYGPHSLHPHLPGAVVVETNAYDVPFAVMLYKCASTFGLVLDKCFHANGNNGCGIVVVWTIHASVVGEIRAYLGLVE